MPTEEGRLRTKDLLASLAALPDDAQITITVSKRDLVAVLEDRDENPERLVSTGWLAKHKGMSARWWAIQAPKIEGAFRSDGGQWRLPIGMAALHLNRHRDDANLRRSIRRGPRQIRTSP